MPSYGHLGMSIHVTRVAPAVLMAALAGMLACVLLAPRRAEIRFEMDRETPRAVAGGFSTPEHDGDVTFAWTGDRAVLRLAGLNRRVPW